MRCCAAVSCTNNSRHLRKWKKVECDIHKIKHEDCECTPPFRWYYFPAAVTVRKQWVRRVNRCEKNGQVWQPRKDSVLCSEHFVEAGPSESYPHPCLKLGYDLGTPKSVRGKPKKRLVPLKTTVSASTSTTNAAESEKCQIEGSLSGYTLTDYPYYYKCECTEICACPGCKKKHFCNLELQAKILELEESILINQTLNAEINTPSVSKQEYSGSMCRKLLTSVKKVRFYTGIPSIVVFDLVYEMMEPKVKKMHYWRGVKAVSTKTPRKFKKSPAKFGPSRKMNLKDEYLLTLMRIKMGLLNEDLADRFHISPGHCSRIFTTWIKALACHLKSGIRMPPPENIRANIPKPFRRHYKGLRGILDCIEFFIQRPRDLEIQSMTHSDYKHHNTAKVLVCITPRGRIGFLSKAWGGRASDKHIVKESGFLDMVENGDKYMVDKGFTIKEDLLLRGAELIIPPAAKEFEQGTVAETKTTKKVANLRIHVERAINRIKWFRILQNTVPITLLPILNSIITVCGALSNLYDPLV